MMSFYSKDTSVYTCYFTREEFNTLVALVCAAVCSYHGIESTVNIENYRKLRDELLNSYKDE